MPRIAALIALGATGALLASCAGDHRSESPARSQIQTPKAHATLTRAQAVAFAHAVNLRATDLPGFRVSPRHERETQTERHLQRKLLNCVGAGGAGRSAPGLAEIGSPSFKRSSGIVAQEVSSSVSVARTSAQATRELAELRSGRTRQCLQSYLDLLFKGPAFRGAPVDHVSISLGVPPSFGTTGSFAWRISVIFTVRSIHVPFDLDVLGFVYGPSQVMLLSSGLPVPFPAAGQEHLFALLVARAMAAHGT
jgi:hypothetical protein